MADRFVTGRTRESADGLRSRSQETEAERQERMREAAERVDLHGKDKEIAERGSDD